MKFLVAVPLALLLAGAAGAIAPPREPDAPPAIIPSPPTDPLPPLTPNGPPGPPPTPAPEPASLTIVGIGLATAGAYRLVQRWRGVPAGPRRGGE